jgi:hypothetical protein
VAFYVPLGPRGLIFRLGTALIGVIGGLVYRRASRRRAAEANRTPAPLAVAEG